MNDLISKSALLAEMELDELDSIDENNREIKAMRGEWNHWKKKIKHFPTVDAVPVVRCEKCIRHNECKFEQYQGLNGFCSLGERKENETN